jgi:uncharacterized protein (TIGR00299 family) protein
MKLAYFDCFSGVSGDMILGAMLDAGLPLAALRDVLQMLRLPGCDIRARRVRRCGLSATKVDVVNPEDPPHFDTFDAIASHLTKSDLPPAIRDTAIAIFKRLARAESSVHGRRHAHLHEVGAIDTLVDVVGAVAGLSLLGVERVMASPIHVGCGTVQTAHGPMPVPAPATALLLRGCPVYATGVVGELTTPTGAAILRTLASSFSPLPAMTVSAVGAGAGAAQREHPNLLRLWIGEADAVSADDEVVQIETQMDDMNPQIYEHVFERLFAAGALDVFLTQIIMKRGRPGILLTVLSPPVEAEKMTRLLFSETTTLGVRIQRIARRTLTRKIGPSDILPIRVKTAYQDGRPLKRRPEFRDVQRIAKKSGRALSPLWDEINRSL